MNTIFSSLSAQERQRVSMLELFDEYEEWHLMCSHYTILCASNGRCRMLENQLLPSRADSVIPLHPCYGSCKVDTLNKTHDSAILKRCCIVNVLLTSPTHEQGKVIVLIVFLSVSLSVTALVGTTGTRQAN